MNLNELVEEVSKRNDITVEMYNSANALIENVEETYTLQQYTALLYVLGKYKEQKTVTTYCGLRILHAKNKFMHIVTKEDENLAESVQAFADETQKKVDNVTKLIDRRFMNINLVFYVLIAVFLKFFTKLNMFTVIGIASLSFMFSLVFILPKSKKRFIESQTFQLRNDLPEELRVFEENIY